jgi:hypothetical protein
MKLIGACVFSLLVGLLCGMYLSSETDQNSMTNGGAFSDQLAQQIYPHLLATGSWAGHVAIDPTNQVHIDCVLADQSCTMMLAQVKATNGLKLLTLEPSYFKIKTLDKDSLRAVDEAKDSCLRTTLLIDRTSEAVSLVRTNEASEQCAQWTGYPRTWVLDYSFTKISSRNRRSQ